MENPMAQGVDAAYSATFRDEPDATAKCLHCGAVWERRNVSRFAILPLFDWESNGFAYSTADVNHFPVCKEYCYACALETATNADFKEFVYDKRNTDDFRAWRMGA